MKLTSLAQSALAHPGVLPAALWAELDAAMRRAPAQWVVHSAKVRSYRLLKLELQVRIDAEGLTALWLSDSPALDTATRMELAQTAQAWLEALRALGLPLPAVEARVQTASPLLSAGFASVAVRGAGDLHGSLLGDTTGMPLAA